MQPKGGEEGGSGARECPGLNRGADRRAGLGQPVDGTDPDITSTMWPRQDRAKAAVSLAVRCGVQGAPTPDPSDSAPVL